MILLTALYEVNLSNSPAFDGEPVVAVNPTDPDNVVVAWLKAALGTSVIAVRYSTDGGITWSSPTFMPHVASGFRSADPTLAFSYDGTLYMAYIDYTTDSGYVVLSYSTDGGATWSPPQRVTSSEERPDKPIDRPWVAVSGNSIYLVSISLPKLSDSVPPFHVYLRYSHDGGSTWSPLIEMGDSLNHPGEVRTMGQLAAGAGDTLFVGFYSYDPPDIPLPKHVVAVSTDGGLTFRYVTSRIIPPSSLVQDSNLKRATPLIYVPPTGTLIATAIDSSYGDPDVVAWVGEDNGSTWSTPFRLNDDPPGEGVYQDMLWGCSKDSTVAFFWRDRRNRGTGRVVPFEIYGTVSFDGGRTFGRNFVVSGQPSQYDTILTFGGNDFLSCAFGDTAIYVVWGDLRDTSSHLDVYLAVVPIEALKVEERRYWKGEGGAIYDASGRKREGITTRGVYFVGRRKVLVR